MNIVICDDSIPSIDIVEELLYRYQKMCDGIAIQKNIYLNGVELLEMIREGEDFDLLLLDVVMPDVNGINLARAIRKHDKSIPIIFMSGSLEHATSAYGCGASDYLLKPIKENEFYVALDRLWPHLKHSEPRPDVDDEVFLGYG